MKVLSGLAASNEVISSNMYVYLKNQSSKQTFLCFTTHTIKNSYCATNLLIFFPSNGSYNQYIIVNFCLSLYLYFLKYIMSRFLKPWRLIIYIMVVLRFFLSLTWKVRLEESIVIKKGGSASIILQKLTWRDKQRLKRTFAKHKEQLATIQPGTYEFTWSYTPQEIIDIILVGPQSIYQRITILEGRNVRDVDNKLVEEWLIDTGDYLQFITDPTIIDRYTKKYAFLQHAISEGKTIATLEGYLYPETYMVDPTKEVIDQLVYLQLEAFDDYIWTPYGDQLKQLSTVLQSKGYAFRLSSYAALVLASVIEKEERSNANKPTIASIFFNRLETNMKLDADITLCYGLQKPYTYCTPNIIVQNLADASNPYNTRAVNWLPPSPIASIHASSLEALLVAPKTDLFFYLHDTKGQLHTAKDISWHNSNKSKYLP